MKFDLVNLQQRVKKSFDPMRAYNGGVHFISTRPQPSPGRMFTICHTRQGRKRQSGALKKRFLVKAKTLTYTPEETRQLRLH